MKAHVLERFLALAQQAQADLSQDKDPKKIRIQVGSATCENAAGAEEVRDEFRKHISASGRTDLNLEITGCTGRCSREPIVSVSVPGEFPVKYQQVNRELVHRIFTEHLQGGRPILEHTLEKRPEGRQYQVMVGERSTPEEIAAGADVHAQFDKAIEAAGLVNEEAVVFSGNSLGYGNGDEDNCGTRVYIRPDDVMYCIQSEADVTKIVQEHLVKGQVVESLRAHDTPVSEGFFSLYGDVGFFRRQSRIALRNAGLIDPEDLRDYIMHRGFLALAKVLEKDDPEWVVSEISKSNLRGRGGGGFPTGIKWGFARKNEEKTRYIICNADEGDPGAFMDRSMLESDPYSIVEGMIIGGYAIGAQYGFFYIRAEYPLAIQRIENAIKQCREMGLLGENILGTNFSFDLEIRLGAGAFVCGEETALIHSIEGERGQPRIRPPFPAQAGLWGKPTIINNVETFANIAPIINFGGDWFKSIGTEKSGGTKVFALAGKVTHTGLVEVPMGTTLREVVFGIGGGVPKGKELKAIQTGGPAGGLIPSDKIDTPVDFDTLGKLGSIMGSGGMIVLDEDDCIVDVAKFYMEFCQDESCGKCTPCREGTKRMLEILERITLGKGTLEDIAKLERLATLVKRSSLCGLGRAAPNPILSTIRHYRDEYIAHVEDKKCPSKKCKSLIRYEIVAEKCVGCTMCARNCPAECISGNRKEAHIIDQDQCIKCGRCYESCRFDAIVKL